MSDDGVVTAPEPGIVHSPAYDLPLSSYLSDAARGAATEALAPPTWMPADGTIAQMRAAFDANVFAPKLERARALYPVEIDERTIDGVRVDIVTPAGGCASADRARVLLNMHGGGFRFGGGIGGLVESVPMAATMGVTVISIDYRLAPEHAHPAALDDVETVYRDVLERYRPGAVGMYGCSAGGVLGAMATARFRARNLPPPGALGFVCAGLEASFGGGDSLYTSVAARGAQPPPPVPNPARTLWPLAYLGATAIDDPTVAIVSRASLAGFPPSLFLTATRDFEQSAASWAHRQLLAAGVDALLVAWDGLAHGFIYDVGIPEVAEAYEIMTRFFRRHLA